ncbi:ROK family protein [Caldalkalibacillus mannanilyticus]|uniref:ROK family protein n=1 Tax=Caldalkalibacillus mannanilyticus TaxID=1418 RepID=UPI000A7EA252
MNELIEEQLCYETGPGESSGGRRPVMLLFHQNAGYAIGIDLGVHYILGILTDLQGNMIHEAKVSITTSSYELTLQALKEMIHSLIQAAPESPYQVIGIGIGAPGIVDHEGRILIAPNAGWRNVELKKDLEQHFTLPVIVENEANAGAYGEKRFGVGKEVDNMIYVSGGIGIGVGLILQNELYRGNNGFAGEMGHMVVEADGRSCKCGSRGCWELYASEAALLREATQAELPLPPEQEITLETLIHLASMKEEKAIMLFNKIGYYLGVGINTIINTFNPQHIIMGNRLAMAKEWIEQPLLEVIEKRTLLYAGKCTNHFYRTLLLLLRSGCFRLCGGSFFEGEFNGVGT